MHITFDNIMEKVVNSRTLSRQEKQNAIRQFLKRESRPGSDKEAEMLESLKALKKSYSEKDLHERKQDSRSDQRYF